MVLRVSAKMRGNDDVDVRAVDGGEHADHSGVDHGRELLDFGEAIAARDENAIKASRDALAAAAGVDAMVDAAAVAANFQRMSRIADASGIPLDKHVMVMTHDIRKRLGAEKFGSARNTDKNRTLLLGMLSPILSGLAIKLMPILLRKKT